MTQQAPTQSVVVGIDGSQAALDAAIWAVAEAVSRDIPLRLVHASAANHSLRPPMRPFRGKPNTPKRRYTAPR